MKIPVGGGCFIEPDEGPRNTVFHKQIKRVRRIPHTRSGHMLVLECGHEVMSFGDLSRTGGVALCTECRDNATEPSWTPTWSLNCLLCDGWKSSDLVETQEHVMHAHGYSQRDLQLNTRRQTEGGYIYTMPDGCDWLKATRMVNCADESR